MAHEQFWLWLNNNLLQAGMNVEYHQTMAYRYWLYGWIANFLTVLLFIFGIVCVTFEWPKSKKELKKQTFKPRVCAAISALLASILLFTPLSTWQSNHRGWQAAWSGVDSQLKDLETMFVSLRTSEPLPLYMVDQVRAIDAKVGQIQGEEPAPFIGLLKQCWGDQLERTYGAGLRTTQQVEEYMKATGKVPPIDQPMRPPPSSARRTSNSIAR